MAEIMMEGAHSFSGLLQRTSTSGRRFFASLASSSARRTLRLASGLVLFAYIAAHLFNHALGLISLETAEAGMTIAVEVWYSLPGTLLLYGAAATHFLLALWAVYERRTFLLPPLEILRIALGFSLPVLLIEHAANTRLAYELLGLPSDYTRVVSNLWATGSQGWQLGLMAPGWLHGCLGLHYVFSRRPLYRQLRFALFAVALLLPVLSALGFIAMGKELAASPAAVAAAFDYLNPANAAQQMAISQWRDNLLSGYFAIIAATFVAREIRNQLESRRNRLVAITYPGQTVRVPRGWSVLEASRSFHLAHASMCGGRARCSTCRVHVTAGIEFCPPPASDEQATLDRIGAPDGVRLACQLCPEGNISVVPQVRTARPVYRQTVEERNEECDIVVLICEFQNRTVLATDHLPQDILYILRIYIERLGNAITAAGGALSYVEHDRICALFGLNAKYVQAAQQAICAASAIEQVIDNLNSRLGLQRGGKVEFAVSIHAGRAVVGEINASDPPTIMAIGEAMDMANELRRIAVWNSKQFAISEAVYAVAGLPPTIEQKVMVRASGSVASSAAFLSNTAPIPATAWTAHGIASRRAKLQRFWPRF